MTDGSGPPASVLKRVTFFLVVGAILFALFDRFGPYQSGRGYKPRPIETVSEAGIVLDRTFDGHFYVSGAINGHAVSFMVDTGASTIAIGEDLAGRLDLGPCRPRRYATAAGTVTGCEARAATVEVAGLRLPDVPVAVLPGADTILLGMDVLRHFRIQQQGGRMELRPGQPGH
jgi:clan AA aspartic protease (TIGR02281 family)